MFTYLKSRKKTIGVFFITSLVISAFVFTNIQSKNNNFRKLAKNAIAGDAEARSTLLGEANSGKRAAEYYYGMTYYIKHDYANALVWLKKSSEKNYARADLSIGTMYLTGQGVKEDRKAAITWFRKAADNGDPNGNYAISQEHIVGEGVPRDLIKSLEFLQKASNGGSPSAQYNLGLKYQKGNGVPLDLPKAVSLFRQSAEKGNLEAQLALGLMYARGDGVEKDSTQAYKWILLIFGATEEGESIRNDAESALRSLVKRMTLAQTRQATEESTKLWEKISVATEDAENAP